MPGHLKPDLAPNSAGPGPGPETDEVGQLRSLNRSPHPYHHRNRDLAHAAHRLSVCQSTSSTPETDTTTASKSDETDELRSSFPSFAKESPTPASDSGTEADDEHYLKGLPAPKVRQHKGLRGRNEALSGASSSTYSPSPQEYEAGPSPPRGKGRGDERHDPRRSFWERHNYRRSKELMRRMLEFAIIATLFAFLRSNHTIRSLVTEWTAGEQLYFLRRVLPPY